MSFGIDARRRQARFLSTSRFFSAAAQARTTDKERRNPYLLAEGYELENLYPGLRSGKATAYFAERGIKWWRSTRSGDNAAVNGPTKNLASSQVACVNFLLPFSENAEALGAIASALDHDVQAVLPIEYESRATRRRCGALVDFEWVGLESTLEGGAYNRGANATSADALLVAETTSGHKRAYLFEWKYVEEYPFDEDKGVGPSGATRRRRYEHLYSAADSPFNGVAPFEAMLYEPFYQLMRLGLLGAKMVREKEFGVSEARVVVVCPEENKEYLERVTSPILRNTFPRSTLDKVVRRTTRVSDAIRFTSQSALASAIRGQRFVEAAEWFEYHEARYGW